MTSNAKTIEGPVQAKTVPFSSVVGQSIMLTDETGAVVAQLSISIPSPSYPYRETAEEVASIIETAINQPPSQQLKKLRARLGKLMVEDAKRMSALENGPACLADAHTNPPLSDLSSLRKGAEVAVPYDDALNEAGWRLSSLLGAHGPVSGSQFNNLKPILKEVIERYLIDRAALVSGSREDGE